MGAFIKKNKKIIGIIVAVIVLIFAGIYGHKAYVNYQNKKAANEVVRLFKHSQAQNVRNGYKNFEIYADAKNKTIYLIANTETGAAISSQLKAYVEAHVSTIERLLGTSDARAEKLDYTYDIEPYFYTVYSSKSYLKDWKINVDSYRNNKLITWYSYQDDKLITSPEQQVEDYISKEQDVHDQNAADITNSIFNAMASNSDE